ncbi:hypothetical protein B0F90DRAFT_1080497 [Multifurca ochricompacta]|uniref:Uncharacterized protein n=1 Tax=Multifurca ochricompacta TaxID=376703 RepID=A0AAD4QQQ5_9AGAM|nr:hypothetical protein B0F90DRAFT_1080497 [Multifurca ochricompacta]
MSRILSVVKMPPLVQFRETGASSVLPEGEETIWNKLNRYHRDKLDKRRYNFERAPQNYLDLGKVPRRWAKRCYEEEKRSDKSKRRESDKVINKRRKAENLLMGDLSKIETEQAIGILSSLPTIDYYLYTASPRPHKSQSPGPNPIRGELRDVIPTNFCLRILWLPPLTFHYFISSSPSTDVPKACFPYLTARYLAG